MELSKLIENEVRDHHGNVIGAIEELLLCPSSGCVSHAVVVCPNKTRRRVSWSEISISENGIVMHTKDLHDRAR